MLLNGEETDTTSETEFVKLCGWGKGDVTAIREGWAPINDDDKDGVHIGEDRAIVSRESPVGGGLRLTPGSEELTPASESGGEILTPGELGSTPMGEDVDLSSAGKDSESPNSTLTDKDIDMTPAAKDVLTHSGWDRDLTPSGEDLPLTPDVPDTEWKESQNWTKALPAVKTVAREEPELSLHSPPSSATRHQQSTETLGSSQQEVPQSTGTPNSSQHVAPQSTGTLGSSQQVAPQSTEALCSSQQVAPHNLNSSQQGAPQTMGALSSSQQADPQTLDSSQQAAPQTTEALSSSQQADPQSTGTPDSSQLSAPQHTGVLGSSHRDSMPALQGPSRGNIDATSSVTSEEQGAPSSSHGDSMPSFQSPSRGSIDATSRVASEERHPIPSRSCSSLEKDFSEEEAEGEEEEGEEMDVESLSSGDCDVEDLSPSNGRKRTLTPGSEGSVESYRDDHSSPGEGGAKRIKLQRDEVEQEEVFGGAEDTPITTPSRPSRGRSRGGRPRGRRRRGGGRWRGGAAGRWKSLHKEKTTAPGGSDDGVTDYGNLSPSSRGGRGGSGRGRGRRGGGRGGSRGKTGRGSIPIFKKYPIRSREATSPSTSSADKLHSPSPQLHPSTPSTSGSAPPPRALPPLTDSRVYDRVKRKVYRRRASTPGSVAAGGEEDWEQEILSAMEKLEDEA